MRKDTLVAAVDCGTTAIKAALFDFTGRARVFATRTCRPISQPDGAVEIDPAILSAGVFNCLKELIDRSRFDPARVAALAVTNQRATVLCADAGGRALGKAIVWQDLRSARLVSAFARRMDPAAYYAATGLPCNPVFTLGKLLWIRKHEPERYRRAACFPLVHDYLLRQLGCTEFFCDWSNASLTGMLDVDHFRWSREILDAAAIPHRLLPTLVAPGERVGALSAGAARRTGLLAGTPLVAGGGDQQCAGIGAGAVRPGVAEITMGTASVPLCFASRPVRDPRQRVTCCAHAIAGRWNVEGLQSATGASLDWTRSLLTGQDAVEFARTLRRAARIEPGARGVLFFPYLAGSSAPHWYLGAAGALIGLNRTHDRACVLRAVMEGVAMETREILDVFRSMGIRPREIRITGGCTSNAVWNGIHADVCGKTVRTLREPQATLLGAAILAARGIGAFSAIEDAVRAMVHVRGEYTPDPHGAAAYRRVYRRYRAVHRGCERWNCFTVPVEGE